jgi:hypothetical protein
MHTPKAVCVTIFNCQDQGNSWKTRFSFETSVSYSTRVHLYSNAFTHFLFIHKGRRSDFCSVGNTWFNALLFNVNFWVEVILRESGQRCNKERQSNCRTSCRANQQKTGARHENTICLENISFNNSVYQCAFCYLVISLLVNSPTQISSFLLRILTCECCVVVSCGVAVYYRVRKREFAIRSVRLCESAVRWSVLF